MRRFVVFSAKGRTRGDFKDLMKAGRLDIIAHSVIASLFLSHGIRKNVELHVILNGPPDPPKHIIFCYDEKIPISKKDVGELLRATLWKYKKGKLVRAFPGVFIEKKSFEEVLEELSSYPIYLLDRKGKNFEEVKIGENPVFVLGDHEGLPKKQYKFAKKICRERVSVGPFDYFTSQCIVVVNNFLDRKNIW
ncbi:MAG TPA: hypothetical protein ENF38_00925 [Candidatus Aenigmarchaeota archaeon]|nr:hypothetical protein [Candidatus Aenigmarchaeota archaeon]